VSGRPELRGALVRARRWLLDLPEVPNPDITRQRDAGLILAAAVLPGGGRAARSTGLGADPFALLHADPAALRAAARLVAAAGAAAPTSHPGVRADRLAVTVAAAALAVRASDLGALAAVLHAAAVLGITGRAVDVHGELDWAVDHLVAQQQPDGGYGTGANGRVELTAECVTALAELLSRGR
jgi:hypothetical protein